MGLRVQPGPVRVRIDSQGFKSVQHELQISASQPARLGTTLAAGTVSEVVTVTGDSVQSDITSRRIESLPRQGRGQPLQMLTPSQNVVNLQRRVAGILPVRVDIPRAGKSYRFVRPLVLEEETTITFQYKSK